MCKRLQVRVVLALLLLSIGRAQATPLAPIGVAGQVSFNFPPITQVDGLGTFSQSGPLGSVQFTASGTPFLSAHATVVPFFFGRASGTLVYQMEVLGPDGDVPVSMTVAGSVAGTSELSTDDIFAGFALSSRWSFSTNHPIVIVEGGITTPSLTGSFSQSFSESHDLMLTANQVYRVTMVADASARAASATAFIDPVFSFGPGVGPEYSFHFSDGILNVPEPDPLALIGVGMIAFGWYRR